MIGVQCMLYILLLDLGFLVCWFNWLPYLLDPRWNLVLALFSGRLEIFRLDLASLYLTDVG